MNLQEQHAALLTARTAAVGKMEAVFATIQDEHRTFSAEEQTTFDTAKAEVEGIDKQLDNVSAMIQTVARATAIPVMTPAGTPALPPGSIQLPSLVPGGIQLQRTVPKGRAFTRYAMALLASRGNLTVAMEIARRWDNETPEVGQVLRAAVAAGTTTDPVWAGPLVQYQNMVSEFIELLRPKTIIGRITGFRAVPFDIRIPRQTTGAVANWVGEGLSKPVSSLGFDAITLGHYKIAVIVAITEELARFSNPSAEGVVQRDLIDTVTQFMDQQFIDPAVTATAGVKPASITNGVVAIPSSGATVDDIIADIKAAVSAMTTAGITMTNPYWVMNPATKINLSMLRYSTTGVPAFPSVGTNGTLEGIPIVDSATVAATGGPPATTYIVLMDAAEILMADDGEVMLDSSREASLQLDTAPATPPTPLVSLWQQNMVAIKAERYINYLRRRNGAVQVISGVQY